MAPVSGGRGSGEPVRAACRLVAFWMRQAVAMPAEGVIAPECQRISVGLDIHLVSSPLDQIREDDNASQPIEKCCSRELIAKNDAGGEAASV